MDVLESLLIGKDGSWLYLLEIVFRTTVMFVTLITFFVITGKKQLRELTIFEFILIIALGSAAGDPMFYKDVPLLHGITVFGTILLIYKLINWLTKKSHKLNVRLQGKTRCIFNDNLINIDLLRKEGMSNEDFFSELRMESISHLGQIKTAYLEFSGEISLYYRADDDVIFSLPIFPESLDSGKKHIDEPGTYSCIQCANTVEFQHAEGQPSCKYCEGKRWVKSVDDKRVQ